MSTASASTANPFPWLSKYVEGVPHSIDYEEVALPGYLARSAEQLPDNTALVFLNCRMTYRELKDQVDRLATAMVGLGLERGNRVAIHMPNIPQTVIAYYAALSAGAQVVLTNPLYTGREIVHQWNDAECVMALTTDFLWDQRVRDVRGELRAKTFIIASVPEYLRFPLNLLAPLKLKKQDPPRIAKVPRESGLHFFRELIKDTPVGAPQPMPDWDSIAVLQYTGGTTGLSKGAMLTHANLSTNVQQLSAWVTDKEYGKEVVLTCLPLFHVFGMTCAMNWGVAGAATLILQPDPRDIPTLVKNVSKHRVTMFPGVPALYNALNSYPGIEKVDVSSIKGCISGSAPIPDDVLHRFESITGAAISEGFGMSESSPVTHANPLGGERKVGSVGIPLPDTESKVVDIETGEKELPLGEEGELIVRGPQVMQGYWNRPEETAETLRDGWLHTGDLAVMDEDGYFRICGRKKDMINCGGYKVFPDEVDGVLMAHDAILEAATIGIPDEKRGESPKTFVVLQPGESLTAEQVVEYCRENLAAYKVPREVEFLDELPKSTVLKVLRRELRDREVAKRGGA